MASCKCFQCGGGFNSSNLDDVEGDGKCPRCKEHSKRVARDIDAKISKYRRANSIPPSLHKQLLDNLPKDGKGGRINARDLGINFEE